MRGIQEFDRLTQVSLQHATQQLEGKYRKFECETVMLQYNIWKFAFFGSLFLQIVITHLVLGFIFVLIGEFLWKGYVFVLTFMLVFTLLFLLFYIIPIRRLSQKGWSPVKIKLDELRQTLRIEFIDQSQEDWVYTLLFWDNRIWYFSFTHSRHRARPTITRIHLSSAETENRFEFSGNFERLI
ncbi:hypothetical protein MIS46_03350 [Wielerella bovis]|uniref:hypothetical protein n=1 Tax=Wielerella bovis TaxID=2917790 RepID=UPI0020185119|nr:hypothetical protein [Wielerella bovis]ULJ63104.1 hypothetical protein MIS46_03350 [Wielerella bovis]